MEERTRYPPATRSVTKDTFKSAKDGEVQLPNPYDWLQDLESEQTKSFTAAQNAAFKAFVPDTDHAVLLGKKKLGGILMETYSQAFVTGSPQFVRNDVFLRVMGRGKPFAVTLRWSKDAFLKLAGEPGTGGSIDTEPTVFHDEGISGCALISSGFSQGGRYWAYNEALSGSDWGIIRVKDVQAGQILPNEEIHDAKFNTKLPAAITWLGDIGFFYQYWLSADEGSEKRPQLRFHVLGQQQAQDEVVFEDQENPTFTYWAQTSSDHSTVILQIFAAGRGNKIKIAKVPRQIFDAGNARKTEVVRLDLHFTHSVSDEFAAEWEYIGSMIEGPVHFFWTNADNGKVMALHKGQDTLAEFVSPSSDQTLKSAKLLENGRMAAVRSVDVEDRLQLYLPDGQQLADLETPAKTIVDISFETSSGSLFLTESSFCHGPRIWAVAAVSEKSSYESREVSISQNLGSTQPDTGITSQRHFYHSKDGTRVPLFVTRDSTVPITADTPVLLYIYGGFGISLIPHFRPEFIAWIRGFKGILATANIRGGSEYGRAWYQAACKEKRQNLFDDIIAAAHFIRSDVTRVPSTPLVLMGESMGALNSSTVMVQQPQLFDAVLLNAGAFDILHRREMGLQGRGGEDIGDPYDPAQFDFIRQWEPLQNLTKGEKYPAVLLTAGTRDDLVSLSHSLKMTAALQYATEKREDSGIVSLKTIDDLGHGGNISAIQRAAVTIDRWLWVVKALRLDCC